MNIYGKKIKIVDKMRFTIALFLLLAAISCVFMLTFNTVSGKENTKYKDYVVARGDTLWTIADIVSSEEIDIREIVYELSVVNDIDGNGTIYPGQTLKIPER